MKTDITELAPAMKAAAGKATPGPWVAFTHTDSRTFSVHTPDDKRCGDVIKWAGFDGQRKAKANAEFIALANPANVLALVEALEKAQKRIDELLPSSGNMLMPALEGLSRDHLLVTTQTAVDNYSALHTKWLEDRQRIAELESRTVTVKQYDEFQICHYGATEDYAKGYIDCQNNFSKWLTAAGIKVEAE